MSEILQIVDGEGCIRADEAKEFVKKSGIDDAGVEYTVVSIMGPQSSGKSTLMNHLFGTRFDEMDAMSGRQQTTHGVWLARSPKVQHPPTLVMDLEGSDGRERGEDDTSFERQSALFALATADILLINMWAKDVGRETGAGKPLLKTIFQVNLKLFQPAPGKRRTILMFVFRDRTKTPLEKLKETWEIDLQRMWDNLAKPPAYEDSSLEDFFEIQYAALSNYEDRQEEFLAETTMLRRRFTDDAGDDESLLRKSSEKLPGQALALSMVKVWEVIKENKDLNLPAHRVMVATIRCKEIAAAQLESFVKSDTWERILGSNKHEVLPDFGESVGSLVDDILSGYDDEARYFDSGVSNARRVTLIEDIHSQILPVYEMQLALASAKALALFKKKMELDLKDSTFVEFAEEGSLVALSEFDSVAKMLVVPGTSFKSEAAAREALRRDLQNHVDALKSAHLKRSLDQCIVQSCESLQAAASPLMENPSEDLWLRLKSIFTRVLEAGLASLNSKIDGYGAMEEERESLFVYIENALRNQMKKMAQEAANTILPRMKDRFSETFHKDEDGMPRTWSPGLDIAKIAKEAKRNSAIVLGHFCIMRLDMEAEEQRAIEESVMSLADPNAQASNGGIDILSAPNWQNIPSDNVLLTPAQVRSAWRQFSADVALSVQQAIATQEANKLARNRVPPVWAIVAMFVLGFNELVSVLRNPLWLLFLLIVLAFMRTVYQELDVEGEMQNGLLPGIMSISAKFMPTVRIVTERTIESFKKFLEGPAEGSAESPASGKYAEENVATHQGRFETELVRRRHQFQDVDSESVTDMEVDGTTPLGTSKKDQ